MTFLYDALLKFLETISPRELAENRAVNRKADFLMAHLKLYDGNPYRNVMQDRKVLRFLNERKVLS